MNEEGKNQILANELYKPSRKNYTRSEEEITIETIKLPRGAGRMKPGLIIDADFLRKKKSTVEIKAKNGCLPRCIVVGMTYHSPCLFTGAECKIIRTTTKSKIKLQEKKAKEICEQAGLDFDSTFELDEIKKFEELCNIKIVVYDFYMDCLYNDKNNKNLNKINIILNTENEHFQFVITKMNAFMGYPYYCDECQKGYSNKELHKCKTCCPSCKTVLCNQAGEKLTCSDCNRVFMGDKCFKIHKNTKIYIDKKTGEENCTLSICERYKKCPDCNQTTFRKVKSKEIEHVCGYKTCSNCKKYTNMDTHTCFIQKNL